MYTEEETGYEDDFDIDNLPFVRHSQPLSTTCGMSEIIQKNSYKTSSSESVEIPNAQHEKYHLQADSTYLSTHNNNSSSIPKFQWTTELQ